MIKSNKIFDLLVGVVICSLLFAAGCAQPVAESPTPDATLTPKAAEQQTLPIEPEKPTPQIVETAPLAPVPAPAEPEKPVTLKLKFTEGDSTTYMMTTESEKNISFEGPVPDEDHFKGGRTFNRIEMVYAQQIQQVKENGNAIAKITIKELNQLTQVKNRIVIDFESQRKTERDKNNPLTKLIGQSYTIEITPNAQVLKVIDAEQAKAAVEDSSKAGQMVLRLLGSKAIKARHEIPTLAAADKSQPNIGDKWSDEETLSFGLMGTKSYEKIYTLKKVKETDDRQIALITMNAIPASQSVDEPASDFSESFDNTEKYIGQLKLDLNAGKAETFFEKVQLKWVTIEPTDEENKDKEPIILRMDATLFRKLEKID